MPTFDLEKAIATWQRQLRIRRAFSGEDVDELTCHLRDFVEARVAAGVDPEVAFRNATARFGGLDEVEGEFGKIYWKKIRHHRRFVHELRAVTTMFLHYARRTLRSMRRTPGYTFINVLGLSAGVACCLLIGLYVKHELTYDRFFPGADRLYRMAAERTEPDAAVTSATTPLGLSAILVSDVPGVRRATRLWKDTSGPTLLTYQDQRFFEDNVAFADSNFFDVFQMPFLEGDPQTALAAPHSLVLTASLARKYFGDAQALGKTIVLREPSDRDLIDYHVTGVVSDPPSNTHLAFGALASLSSQRWSDSTDLLDFGVYTYLQLDAGTPSGAVEARLPALIQAHAGPQLVERQRMTYEAYARAGYGYRYFLQHVPRIHLYSHLEDELTPNGDVRQVTLFGAVALLILLVACVNYANLATARSTLRAREVGIRKATGAHRSQLVVQFFGEAGLLVALALVLAVAFAVLARPLFTHLTGVDLPLRALVSPWTAVALAGVWLFVTAVAGGYPAWLISWYQPAPVLKGTIHTSRSAVRVRQALVVFQFAVSIFLIGGALIVRSQIDYMLRQDLGFDESQVVVLEGTEMLGRRIGGFEQAAGAVPGVVRVTNAETVPGRSLSDALFHTRGAGAEHARSMAYTFVSFGYPETLGLDVVEGRTFSADRPADSLAVMLNETAAQALGAGSPVGQTLVRDDGTAYTVIGVVKDFHVASLKQDVGPVVLLGPDPEWQNRPNLLVPVRIEAGRTQPVLEALGDLWQRFVPEQPFTYTFLDRDFAALYRSDRRTRDLISAFAALAILIACLGLVGLAAYVVERRTKEIGVRKVLGASAGGLVMLLSREFMALVAAAFLIAAPLTMAGAQRWLDGYAYRIGLLWPPLVVAGVLVGVAALVAVAFQCLRAATVSPVKSLRYE